MTPFDRAKSARIIYNDCLVTFLLGYNFTNKQDEHWILLNSKSCCVYLLLHGLSLSNYCENKLFAYNNLTLSQPQHLVTACLIYYQSPDMYTSTITKTSLRWKFVILMKSNLFFGLVIHFTFETNRTITQRKSETEINALLSLC